MGTETAETAIRDQSFSRPHKRRNNGTRGTGGRGGDRHFEKNTDMVLTRAVQDLSKVFRPW